MQDSHPKGCSFGSTDDARFLVGRGRLHNAVDDALMAEFRTAEQGVVGADQSLVAAPVDAERCSRARLSCRLDVCVDVSPAEGVDRLFGIADQHEGGVTAPK